MDDELDKALVRLRDRGLGSFPPDDLPALRDRSVELGEQLDAAWPFVLASAIDELWDCWGYLDQESGQGVPTAVVHSLDAAVRDPISAIVASRSQTERLASCRGLRTVVRETLAVADPL